MTTKTKHSTDCQRVFNRYDPECPRCRELAAGSAPREWRGDRARRMAEQDARWIREHDCRSARCGPICTFGDW